MQTSTTGSNRGPETTETYSNFRVAGLKAEIASAFFGVQLVRFAPILLKKSHFCCV
jgi:hypothetical protein